MLAFFYASPTPSMDLVANPKQKISPEQVPEILALLRTTLSGITDWNHAAIVAALESAVTASGLKKGQILWPLRAMLTGQPYSPGAYEVAELLGKEETMRRLEKSLKPN